MEPWISWRNIVALLRRAFSRGRTFSWFCVGLVALAARTDPLGMTSFVRALGLPGHCRPGSVDEKVGELGKGMQRLPLRQAAVSGEVGGGEAPLGDQARDVGGGEGA